MTTAAQHSAQANRGTIFLEDGEIIDSRAFAGNQFIQRIRAPKCARTARAGTFVHVTCDTSLPMRRPLSIMRADDDWIEVLFKTGGEGLTRLAEKAAGDTLSVLGPIGRPFNPDPARPNALLIGGGVGIPPMVFLADVLRRSGGYRPRAILGSEIPFPFERVPATLDFPGIDDPAMTTMPLLESWSVPTRLTSLADYEGCFRGFVTDLADRHLAGMDDDERRATKVFTCGPTPMLRAVAELAGRYDVPCEVSLEEFMACAVGGCAGCTVLINSSDGPAMKRVCVDGPVFDASTVAWDQSALLPG